MIEIAQTANGQPFIYRGYSACPYPFNEVKDLFFIPLYGPFSYRGDAIAPFATKRVMGMLTTGVGNLINDKPCTHRKVDGQLTLDPVQTRKVLSNENCPLKAGQFRRGTLFSPRDNPTEYQFSHVITEGTDISFSVEMSLYRPKPTSLVTYEGTYFFRAGMSNGVFWYGLGYIIHATDYLGRPSVLRSLGITYFCEVNPTTLRSKTGSLSFETSNDFLTSRALPTSWSTASPVSALWPDSQGATMDAQMVAYHLDFLSDKYLKKNFLPDLVPEVDKAYNYLSQTCADQARYTDVNGIAYLNDIRNVKSLLPKIGSLKNPKTYANLFLCFRYGLSLSIADTEALGQAIVSSMTSGSLHSHERTVRDSLLARGKVGKIPYLQQYHYKLKTWDLPDPAMRTMLSAYRWGLYPTLENLWDLVPYSFVVDWAVDISSLLHTLDTDIWSQYYTVDAVCRSRKVVVTLPISTMMPSFPGSGMVDSILYVRETPTQVDIPLSPFDSRPFTNYVEATALIVQKIK